MLVDCSLRCALCKAGRTGEREGDGVLGGRKAWAKRASRGAACYRSSVATSEIVHSKPYSRPSSQPFPARPRRLLSSLIPLRSSLSFASSSTYMAQLSTFNGTRRVCFVRYHTYSDMHAPITRPRAQTRSAPNSMSFRSRSSLPCICQL